MCVCVRQVLCLFFAKLSRPIPPGCVCRWYFPDTKRLDAEKMLQAEGNLNGAFLIRDCESQRGELSLSGETREEELIQRY